jgi:hypothetical protein
LPEIQTSELIFLTPPVLSCASSFLPVAHLLRMNLERGEAAAMAAHAEKQMWNDMDME